MTLTDFEAMILSFCNNKVRTTSQLHKCLQKIGKGTSYNYVNKTLNELADRGLMRKRKPKGSKISFFTTKPQGIRTAVEYWQEIERQNRSKEEAEKAKMMMNNRRLCAYC